MKIIRTGIGTRATAFLAALACLLSIGSAAAQEGPRGLLGVERAKAMRSFVTGEWTARVGSRDVSLALSPSGRYAMGGAAGAYAFEPDTLTLMPDGGEAVEYALRLDGDAMILSGGDLRGDLRFFRRQGTAGMLGWILDLSPDSATLMAWRLILIALTVAVARVLIAFLRTVSYVLVVSDRGPLRYIYRNRRNRTLTIHSLALNAVKYGVYIVALGAALSELGINYMAYVASLSIVGLAVGFGAQGLVQDLVSGIFVLVEGQFDVGDMVEIAGQTGVVEELGLRMTRIRNWQGQTVVIPNRGIASVANYSRGGLRYFVDVTAKDAEAASEIAKAARTVAANVEKQFGGVLLGPPELRGPLALDGEAVARLSVIVWPGQQWVVTDHLVPRLREAAGDGGLRFSVFVPARHETA